MTSPDGTEATVTRLDGKTLEHFTLDANHHLVKNEGSLVYEQIEAVPTDTTPVVATASALTEDQARAVVLIKGDKAQGTGFLVRMPDGPVVMTNIHVISDNPNLKITTNSGTEITVLSYKSATDRDLAMLAIKDDHYSYLSLATDVSGTVQSGDQVITPGNSEGGGVILNTSGKVLGVGPDRVEFDNPVYHGNSGGPVFHLKSGKVIGIVTEAVKVDISNDLDKASFASRNSAIHGSMRYFGLRLDTVPKWEPCEAKLLQNQTAFLDQFDQRSRCLDSYLNAPVADKKSQKKKPENKGDNDYLLYLTDPQIVQANNNYFDLANGADTAQQIDALRQLVAELASLAGTDMDAIQSPANFYAFEELRAKDEIAYRQALQKELTGIANDVSRLGSLPRTNLASP